MILGSFDASARRRTRCRRRPSARDPPPSLKFPAAPAGTSTTSAPPRKHLGSSTSGRFEVWTGAPGSPRWRMRWREHRRRDSRMAVELRGRRGRHAPPRRLKRRFSPWARVETPRAFACGLLLPNQASSPRRSGGRIACAISLWAWNEMRRAAPLDPAARRERWTLARGARAEFEHHHHRPSTKVPQPTVRENILHSGGVAQLRRVRRGRGLWRVRYKSYPFRNGQLLLLFIAIQFRRRALRTHRF